LRQEVNLLPQDIGKTQRRSLAYYLVATSALLVVAVAAIGGLLAYTTHVTTSANERLAARETNNRAVLSQLQANEATHSASADLIARVAQRQLDLAARRALHAALSAKSLGNTTGFSPLLTGLAEHKPESVWLRSILFAAGGRLLDLQGSALDPAAIPAYLQRFSADRALAGRQVQRLEITLPGELARHVDFTIRAEQQP
jgi:hypothetical protein